MRRLLPELAQIRALLTEGLSQILYHKTELHAALAIMQDNSFDLSSNAGSSSDAVFGNPEKRYFLSTTRSKAGTYERDVTFVLDGRKLAQRFSGAPVDYWGPTWRKEDPASNREMEDRIFSPDPTIEPATKYITAIHVYLITIAPNEWWKPAEGYEDAAINKPTRHLWMLAKKHKIPIYGYDNKTAYKLQNTAKAVDFSRVPVKPAKNKQHPDFRLGGYKSSMWHTEAVLELYHSPVDAELSVLAKKFKQNLYYAYNIKDSAESVMAEIANRKNKPEIRGITKVLQDEGVDVVGLLRLLAKKWIPAT